MYNGANNTSTNSNNLSDYQIVAIVSAVFSGLASLIAAFMCYRQKAKFAEKHTSEINYSVKGPDNNGNYREVSCSIKFLSDEKDSTMKVKPSKEQAATKKPSLETKEEKDILNDDLNEQSKLLFANDAREDTQRGTMDLQILTQGLTGFYNALKVVFLVPEQENINIIGENHH